MSEHRLTLDEVEDLAAHALERAGAPGDVARSVARSTRRAEADGIRSHGLLYVPVYAAHLRCGKVRADACPQVSRPRIGHVAVDADNGFAHPAIDAGWEAFTGAARESGIAALSVHNSYNCGVLGHHAERLAEAGLMALCMTHAPASIAPPGGAVPVIGTNPFSVAVPDGQGGAVLVLDQSASVVAKSEVLLRAREGREIEPGWARDADGNPTTNAQAALSGSMEPAGGVKGFGAGLMVELFAAVLAGANLSVEASPFGGTEGGPPGTGQFFIACDPAGFAPGFTDRVERLSRAITGQEGARLPGARRKANRARISAEGVAVDDALMERLRTC